MDDVRKREVSVQVAIAEHRAKAQVAAETPLQYLPLTAAQRGMWFAESLAPDYSVNIAQYLDIRHPPGGLDIELLAECSIHVGKHLESPYTRLAEVDGVPMQFVDLDFDQQVDILDFRAEPDPAGAALAWMRAEYQRPVDLLNDQFVIAAILQVGDERTFFYNRAHHIVLDGYAALTGVRRTIDRYNALRRGLVPDDKQLATMAEIVEYEQSYQNSSRRDTDRAHWLERVVDLPERVTLSTRSAAVAPLSFANVVSSQELEPASQRRLEALATELNSSIAVLLTAAFGAYLSRVTANDDIVMSLPITGRTNVKIKRSGGMVSNIVPIRLRDPQGKSVRDLIATAQLELTGALRHQRYRSDDIRRDAGLDAGSTSFGPAINMVFFDEPVAIDGTESDYRILTSGILEDLLINMYQSGPAAPLVVDLHGNPGLYTQAELDAHHARFLHFLEDCLAPESLDRPVGAIEMLTPADRAMLAALPEPAAHGSGEPATIVSRFGEVARRHPDRPAVTDARGVTVTYRELGAQAAAVAAALRARGVGPGDLVGVATARHTTLVAAIMGVLTGAAAYLPLDTSNPVDRLSFIVGDAAPVCVIVDDDASRPDWSGTFPVVSVDELISEGATAPAPPAVPDDTLAYVIYTSGSTGRPKGVEITHHNVIALLDAAQEHFEFGADDVWSVFHSYAFDFSVWEIFGPLLTGGRAVIVDRQVARAPAEFLEVLARENVTVVSLTPSAFGVLAEARRRTPTPLSLRYMVFGGEELRFDEVERWYDAFGDDVALVNMYGITETTVHVTYRPLDPELVRGESSSLIGQPLSTLGVRILDNRLQPTPEGAIGEIYVVGEQLALGYRNRAALTASRFVADPDGSGRRMYRSGDLGRRVGDDVQYLGRADTQVQLRGFRVELGEVETALRSVGGVTAAAAVVLDARNAGGAKLIGYAVVDPAAGLDESSIRDAVRAAVPTYMVPDLVMLIDELPITANGKLDRRALPTPRFARDERVAFIAPSTAREIAVASVIGDVLDVTPIGMHDNIFALGADSLTAARIVSRLRSVARLSVSLSDVFEAGTLAEIVAAAVPTQDAAALPLPGQVERPVRIPLSLSQQRLWFINRLDPASGAYNIPGAVRLGSDVDADALAAAVGDLVSRHEPLRTTFPDDDGETFQSIGEIDDVTAAGVFGVEAVDASAVDARIADLSVTGFDVTKDWPLRIRLLAVSDSADSASGETVGGSVDHVLVVVVHHIAADGASLGPLITDLLTAYAARAQRQAPEWTSLPVQFADFAVWQRSVLGEEADADSVMGRQIAFWRKELQGMPELIGLPTDRQRPTRPTGAGGYVDTMLDAQTVERLHALAAHHGVTLFAVFHSALAVLLSRLSGGEDIAIGTAIAGRDEPELADLVGMFVNTVVLRTRVQPADGLTDLLASAHHTRAQALGHGDVPFEQVVNAVGARRSRSHSPLFQVELVMQHDQVVGRLDAESGLGLIDARPPFAKYDLSLNVIEFGPVADHSEQISLSFCYSRELFDHSTIERFSHYLHDILDRMAATLEEAQDRPLDDLFWFPDSELDVVAGWSRGYSEEITRPLLLAAAASERRATALVHDGRRVSYREFADRVNSLARELIGVGVGPDVAVAVCIPRSVELLVALHAVITAGGQYVPIDPDAPLDRGEYMVEMAGVGTVLVGPGALPPVVSGLADRVWVHTVDASAPIEHAVAPVTTDELIAPLLPDHAAYTIFTSGSTGKPKGVTVSHRAIVNRLEWMQRHYPLSTSDVVLQKTPITFDVSVWELFWPFMVGASLVIAEPGRHGDPEYLASLIESEGVTTMHFVPSMMSTFADVTGPTRMAELSSLRLMFTSGEALAAPTARSVLSALPGLGLHNLYGPTEAAVDVTEYHVGATDTAIPIGRPVANTTTFILDRRLRPLPVGVPGELYLGGVQLARGYAAQGRLTAERFVADPFGPPGSRLYRTGDLARWNTSGDIEYLGRNDFQVKLRGQRLELGEIEASLVNVPGVVHAAATVIELAAGQNLVAYYSPDTVAPDTAAAHLAEHLPEFMVPTIWMPMEQMPLNSAGKVDRRALPEPVLATAPFVGPSTDTERIIGAVFAEVLGVEKVSVTESFFDLGGNSLSATKVAARLSAELGIKVPLAAVFDAPSVREAAQHVRGMDTPHHRPVLAPARRGTSAPLSAVQRGMWLINRADPASPVYNVAIALRLSGALDRTSVDHAFADLVSRHESLRTMYPMLDGEPVQLVLEPEAALTRIERSVRDVRGDVDAEIATVTGGGFDVTAGPPLRLALLAVAPDDHILVFVVHHIAADGASMMPLATDFMAAYTARVSGVAPAWEPLAVQYADYAVWHHDWLDTQGPDGRTEATRQLDYWTGRLAGAPARLELPTDRVRPRVPTFAGDEVVFEVPGELVGRLDAVARQNNATLFMVMHAAFAVLLSRLTAQRDIVIGTPFAGREQAELDGVIGMFVNTLALRTQIREEEKFAELLQRVRHDDLADMANADIPFDSIVSSVAAAPATSHHPIYQVMFAYQNFAFPTVDLADLTITPVSEQLVPAKVDLQLTLFPDDPHATPGTKDSDVMKGQLIYAKDLYNRSSVELHAQRYLRVLEEVAENPQVLVDDISIATDTEAQAALDAAGHGYHSLSIPELVAAAANAAPDAVAASHNGTEVTFAVLSAITDTMASALPDADSALTTALMSLIPDVAVSGPQALGDVLGDLRSNSLVAVGDSAGAGRSATNGTATNGTAINGTSINGVANMANKGMTPT
ncbi:putative non-ribosomal peptide synthetase [Gordonia polyisoprenivorans VH2]|uniref:Putative non-ribosomal peptide synthetase n=1 Tax=Gordonia polyisoprenivorans (strain DSM 44266 / VH2) TaxID=1112204 RepID=H6N1T4_GORPV|nr:non-ribosomal peptide synthetase [Gordonia polyisoprenivorans]AFA74604.1 putative non-ribosomal peptide synthetase [Gordonia polyisoprenivorans VH2]